MNKVSICDIGMHGNYTPGDLFINKDDDVIMLVENGNGTFSTVMLSSGLCWTGPKRIPDQAVTDIKFIGRNLRIEIKNL